MSGHYEPGVGWVGDSSSQPDSQPASSQPSNDTSSTSGNSDSTPQPPPPAQTTTSPTAGGTTVGQNKAGQVQPTSTDGDSTVPPANQTPSTPPQKATPNQGSAGGALDEDGNPLPKPPGQPSGTGWAPDPSSPFTPEAQQFAHDLLDALQNAGQTVKSWIAQAQNSGSATPEQIAAVQAAASKSASSQSSPTPASASATATSTTSTDQDAANKYLESLFSSGTGGILDLINQSNQNAANQAGQIAGIQANAAASKVADSARSMGANAGEAGLAGGQSIADSFNSQFGNEFDTQTKSYQDKLNTQLQAASTVLSGALQNKGLDQNMTQFLQELAQKRSQYDAQGWSNILGALASLVPVVGPALQTWINGNQ